MCWLVTIYLFRGVRERICDDEWARGSRNCPLWIAATYAVDESCPGDQSINRFSHSRDRSNCNVALVYFHSFVCCNVEWVIIAQGHAICRFVAKWWLRMIACVCVESIKNGLNTIVWIKTICITRICIILQYYII